LGHKFAQRTNYFSWIPINPLIGAPSDEKYIVSNPDNIEYFNKTIMDIIKELPPSTIVFGSLSTIMDLCGEKETIEAVRNWNKIGDAV